MKERREAWFDSQLDHDLEKLVFIDETWTTTNMARKNGRAPTFLMDIGRRRHSSPACA